MYVAIHSMRMHAILHLKLIYLVHDWQNYMEMIQEFNATNVMSN